MTPGIYISKETADTLADALLSREVSRTMLIPACLNFLRANNRIAEMLDLAWRQDEQALDALLADGTLVALLNTRLMQALLMTTPIPNLAMERLLTHVRRRLLTCSIDTAWFFNSATLKTASALSVHNFLNEYVYFESKDELNQVEVLCKRLEDTSSDALDPFDVCMAGCYRPLGSHPFSDKLKVAPWYQGDLAMQMVVRVQVDEPANEQKLILKMPTLSPIKDETSHAVQSLYEENPYPRWVSYIKNELAPPSEILSNICIGYDESAFGKPDGISILVAGCGTGIAAIEDAVLWNGADIQAVDLSRASLAYAKRCAEELQIESISFAQADILELPNLGRTFDYISCVGVLHHMGDPIEGLRALGEVCRPGGVMRIGLYSKASRRSVPKAISFMKTQDDGSTMGGIRQARQSLIDHAHRSGVCEEEFNSLFTTIDFYTTSMCRDLLFHVQEVDFTATMIENALDLLGLKFCGFVNINNERLNAYRAFAPHDPKGLDLKSWAKYEQQNPDAFSSLYDFTVQKPLA